MRPAPLLCASLLTAGLSAAPACAAIVVNIDKNAQQMTVTVDGSPRYVWPVSTGRAGYDTPNGVFKVNRMDADHLSQEWDNAPMPHTMFFDMHGHAIHGFFDVKHLGMPVSHGCVRLAPDNATILFNLVEAQGMKETSVIISGQAPAWGAAIARQRGPAQDVAAPPMQLAPDYGQQPPPGYAQPQPIPSGYGAQGYGAQGYGAPDNGQAYYQQPQPNYQQPQPNYRTPPPGYVQPQQPYYGQSQQPSYGQPTQQPAYAQQPQPPRGYDVQQPAYPPQPPPVQYYVVRPFGQ
jgi:hypothetical protein